MNVKSLDQFACYSNLHKCFIHIHLTCNTDEIQSFADRKDIKKFFDDFKTVYGPKSSRTTPHHSAHRTSPLADKEAGLKKMGWTLFGVLNRPSSINDDAINRLPQIEWNPLLDEFWTVSETVKAIKLLSSGKAPGADAIPTEIYKARGSPVAEKLTELFHIMWRKEAIPKYSRLTLSRHRLSRITAYLENLVPVLTWKPNNR